MASSLPDRKANPSIIFQSLLKLQVLLCLYFMIFHSKILPQIKAVCVLGLQLPCIPQTEEFSFKSFLIFHLTFLIYFRFQAWFCFKPLLLKSGFATKSLKEIFLKKNHLLSLVILILFCNWKSVFFKGSSSILMPVLDIITLVTTASTSNVHYFL